MEQTAKASEDQVFNYIWSSAELGEKGNFNYKSNTNSEKIHSNDQPEFSCTILMPACPTFDSRVR